VLNIQQKFLFEANQKAVSTESFHFGHFSNITAIKANQKKTKPPKDFADVGVSFYSNWLS